MDKIDGGRLRCASYQVHRHDGIFAQTAALQEQHLVIGRDRQQCAQVAHGGLVDRDELGTAVTHLHDRHAAAVPVEHLGGGLFEHFLGQDGGAGGEVIDMGHGDP